MQMENQFWFLKDESKTLYYDYHKKKWVSKDEYTGHCYPATFPCRSFRSARRHLKKHEEIPKGMKFTLVSKFVGFDRFLIKK